MADTPALKGHLVRVTTDDREHQLWVAATPREDAITQVLNAVPEGWTAALLSNRLKPAELEVLNLKPGEVRELTLNRRGPSSKPN
jgi:hypothetical protein